MKLAASPGFAPGPPVSETGALLIMQRGNGRPGGNCTPNMCPRDRHDPVSPPGGNWLRDTDSHHQHRFQRATSCLLRYPALVEPEVVAGSAARIKSPGPV